MAPRHSLAWTVRAPACRTVWRRRGSRSQGRPEDWERRTRGGSRRIVTTTWARASTFLYPADAPVPEISRASGAPLLLVTTHPTSVSSQLIPSAQLTYIRQDVPGAPSAEALAQVVVTVLRDPPRVRLSPSSGRPWDLDPHLLHRVTHAGALTVQVKLRRGAKASLHGEDWTGWQDPWRSWLAEGEAGGTNIALQFPETQRDDARQITNILGAAIPDSVEKRSFATTTHPLNRTRRSGAAGPAVHDRGRGAQSHAVRRSRGPPGDRGIGPGEDPPQAPALSGDTQGTQRSPPGPPVPAPPPEDQSGSGLDSPRAGPGSPEPPPSPGSLAPGGMGPRGDPGVGPVGDLLQPASAAGSPGGGQDRGPPQADPGALGSPLTPNLPAGRQSGSPRTPASPPTPPPQAAELPQGVPRT